MSEKLINEVNRFDESAEIGNAYTPPATWYRDNEFLELEKRSLFLKKWSFAGHTSDLKNIGDYFTGSIADRPFVVLNDDGVTKAFFNVCSHHGTCVARGKGKTDKLVCPYHGWQYNLEGQLKKIPKAGAILDIHKKGLNLKQIPVHTAGPFVFLYLGDGEAPEFSTQLTNHFDRPLYQGLNFIKRVEYEIGCNWKVFVDNYLDGGYHVPHMHPGLTTQIDLASYQTEIFDMFSIQYCSGVEAETLAEEVKGRVEGKAEYSWAYPNLMVNRYGKWMDTNWALPIDENRCLIIFDYFHEEMPENIEASLKASHQVQKEDMDICDMVQAGLKSEVYDRGVYAPQFEKPMFHFHQLLKESFLKELS